VTVERNKTDSLFLWEFMGLSTLKATPDLCRCCFAIVRTIPVFLSLHILSQIVIEMCRGKDVLDALFTITQHSVSGPCGHLMHHCRRQTQLQILPVPLTPPYIYIYIYIYTHTLKLNSVALVRTRTIPTERPPPVGEVSANFCG